MGLWDTLTQHAKAQFLDVIQWMDDSRDTLVYRFPMFQQAIQDGGKLVVREGQAGIFIAEGRLSEVFGPGTYTLSTNTKAIGSFFESIKYSLNYPFKGDVYFVSTRQNTDQKWGTPNPIMMRDKDFGMVRLRAFGIYAYRISDPAVFLREVVGTNGWVTTEEINGQLKRKLVSALADTIGESKIAALDLGAHYMDFGDALRQRLNGWFQENYGITLTDFVVENISLPPEVEKMMDTRTSMGVLGDMGAYTQFQTANAIQDMANRPGASNVFMDAGMGMAMGGQMGQQMGQQMGRAGQFNPAQVGAPSAAPPPPPPPVPQALFHYNAPDGTSAQLAPGDIAQRVMANPTGRHLVWRDGMAGWTDPKQVAEIAAAFGPPPPPPPPPLPR